MWPFETTKKKKNNLKKIIEYTRSTDQSVEDDRKKELEKFARFLDELFSDESYVDYVHDQIERTAKGEFLHEKGSFCSSTKRCIDVPGMEKFRMMPDAQKILYDHFDKILDKGFKVLAHGSASVSIDWCNPKWRNLTVNEISELNHY